VATELTAEGDEMNSTNIEPLPVQWRMLAVGSTCWAPFGNHGWRAGTVLSLGKNRGDNTVVHLSFETGGQGRRTAGELYWRKVELKGRDKPKRPSAESPEPAAAAGRGRAIDTTAQHKGRGVGIAAPPPVSPGAFRQQELFKS
jgi:hypothetical protein